MAKDTTTGPVSKPEGGHYESSEDIRMTNEELPQTEVVREFDKELAAMLVEGGYYSLFQIAHASDGVLMGELKGLGLEELAVIREKAPYEPLIPITDEPVLAEIEVEVEVEVEIEVEVEEAEVLTQGDVTVEGEPDPDTISQPVGEDPAVEEEELPELADLVVGPVGATAPVAPVSIGLSEILGDKIGSILIENGYVSIRSIAIAKDAELLAIKGVGKATLKKIREVAVFTPAPLPTTVDSPQVSARVRRSMESAKSQ